MNDSEAVLDAWRINDRATRFLVEHIPAKLWTGALPTSPRRTVRSIAVHIHNSRRMWIKGLGAGAGTSLPASVDRLKASPEEVSVALETSGARVLHLLEAGLENGGDFPGVSSRFIWGAWPRNVVLFLAYAVAHEAHHRGQVLVVARALDQRLPARVVSGLWQWSSRLRESRPKRPAGV